MTPRGWGGFCVFLFSFALLLSGAAPSITVGDAGEFITASSILGIPHPSGFPTYTILGKMFLMLIPWANPAFHLNLFSALAVSGSISIVFLFLADMTASPAVACCGSLLLLGAPAVLMNGESTEVFALHLLFASSILWSALKERLELSAFLTGLAAGNHQTIFLLAPAVMWSCRHLSLKRWAESIGWGLLGFSVYFALYLRAQQQPFLNVGHADSWERWARVLRRSDFGSLTLALGQTPDRTLWNTMLQLKRFLVGTWAQIGWIGLGAGALGLYSGLRHRSALACSALAAWITTGPVFFVLGNLPFDAQSQGLLERFYVLPTLCWALLAGAGLADYRRFFLPVGFLAALLAAVAVHRADAVQATQEWADYAYGCNVLKSLAPNTRFIIDGGDDTFYALAYLTQVEHRRADLELHDRGGIVFAGLYGDDFRTLDRDAKESRRQFVERSLAHADRPLAFSTMNPQIMPGRTLTRRGLVYTVDPSTETDGTSFYDYRGIAPWMKSSFDRDDSYRLRALVPIYAYQCALFAASHHRLDEAQRFFESAFAQAGDVSWLQGNAVAALQAWAYQAIQAGDWKRGKALYDDLLNWEPGDLTGRLNRGAAREHLGDSQASDDYREAVRDHPESAVAHFNWAASAWRQHDWTTVTRELQAVLAIDPQYPNAAAFLQRADLMTRARPS